MKLLTCKRLLALSVILAVMATVLLDLRIWIVSAVVLALAARMCPGACAELDAAQERQRDREAQIMADAADRDDFAVQLNRERMFREYDRV